MGRHNGRNQGESLLLMRRITTPPGQTKADDSMHIPDRVYINAIIRRKFCQLARNSLEMTKRTGYLALTGEVAEWSKALPC